MNELTELREKLAWVEEVYSPDWDCYEQFGRVLSNGTPLDAIRDRARHTVSYEHEFCLSQEEIVANELMEDRLTLLHLIDDVIRCAEECKNNTSEFSTKESFAEEILWRLEQ